MGTSAQEQYKEKRDFWIGCFSGKDRHCILTQIYRMVWNTAVFKVINEARRIAPSAKEGGVELNGIIHRLIDDGYFESQLMAIRRLTDKSCGIDGKRGVFSLISVIDDMKSNAKLLTRENIFLGEGLEYDYEAVRAKNDQYCNHMIQVGCQTFSLPSELDWERIKQRHEELDCLCGVDKNIRSPTDSIVPKVFDLLKDKILRACENIHDHADKFVAHAASPDSRQIINADNIKISLTHLWQAHEIICRSANFIAVYLLTGGVHFVLPVPQYNQFAYIERPLISADKIRQLAEIWDKYEKETHQWQPWKPEDIVK